MSLEFRISAARAGTQKGTVLEERERGYNGQGKRECGSDGKEGKTRTK